MSSTGSNRSPPLTQCQSLKTSNWAPRSRCPPTDHAVPVSPSGHEPPSGQRVSCGVVMRGSVGQDRVCEPALVLYYNHNPCPVLSLQSLSYNQNLCPVLSLQSFSCLITTILVLSLQSFSYLITTIIVLSYYYNPCPVLSPTSLSCLTTQSLFCLITTILVLS